MARVLGTVDVCNSAIPIIEGDSGDREEMGANYGMFDPSDEEIWVHSGLPVAKLRDTMTHEVLHALIAGSGVIDMTAASFGLDRADTRLSAWEETFVRILTPHLVPAFKLLLNTKNARNRY